MNAPPERKSPALVTPGCDRNLVRGIDRSQTYAEAGEISTAAKPEANLPDFETGWMRYVENCEPAGYVAFLRPWHEGWYDLHHFDNWVDAISCAFSLTSTRPNCTYVGGPGA